MNYKKLSLGFMVIELITAITKYGIYTFPFYGAYIGAEFNWEPRLIGIFILQALFLLLPLTAVGLALKNNNWAFLFAAAFPIVAFVFGVAPVPFANYLYGSNHQMNSIVIGIVNASTVFLCWWLYQKVKRPTHAI